MFRSLRFQLFLGIFVILLGAGGIIMVSTQQQMEQALIDAENRAARNVLNLIELQVSNRYRELLMEKVRIVAERRSTLEQMGNVITATFQAYERLVERGYASQLEAQSLALEWASRMDLGDSADAFAMTREGHLIAHRDRELVGRNLGALPDLKGRSILEATEEGITNFGYAYVIYEDEVVPAGVDDGRRFAYFIDVPEFDLYIGISDRIGDVERYVETGVEATIEVLAESVGQVQVVETGFVFIFDRDLQTVTSPADWASAMVGQSDEQTGQPIMEMFRDAGQSGDGEAVHYTAQLRGGPLEMEAYVSYFRPLGWYVASTVPTDEISAPARALVQRQVLIFAMVLGASLLLAWFFAYKITGPLQRLAAYARRLPTQDFTTAGEGSDALNRLARARSEVGGLARAFGFMEGELRDNIQALLNTTREKERIESELNIAQEIQRGLLPKIFPPFPDCPQIDLHAALYPARHVGGDLFDFYFLDEHRLLFTVGDVADKGVPSALFMAITKTLVKSASGQDADPATMMERVNNDLSADNPSAMFVTLLIGILDIRTGRVEYVNAGQNPPILVPADGKDPSFIREISGPPGGAIEGVSYRHLSLQLDPGDTLVVFTDGITEAMNPANEEYGNDRLLALCGQLRGESAEHMVATVVEDVNRHSGEATQSDDITLLCLTWQNVSPQAAKDV